MFILAWLYRTKAYVIYIEAVAKWDHSSVSDSLSLPSYEVRVKWRWRYMEMGCQCAWHVCFYAFTRRRLSSSLSPSISLLATTSSLLSSPWTYAYSWTQYYYAHMYYLYDVSNHISSSWCSPLAKFQFYKTTTLPFLVRINRYYAQADYTSLMMLLIFLIIL